MVGHVDGGRRRRNEEVGRRMVRRRRRGGRSLFLKDEWIAVFFGRARPRGYF